MAKKPYNKMSVKDLQKEISKAVSEANKRVNSADKTSKAWSKQVQHLKDIGLTGKRSTFAGNTKGLKKTELIVRLRELEYFNGWDTESAYGRRAETDRERKAYETFLKDNPNWSYEEWREMVEVVGALGDDFIKKNYSSDDVKEIFERASSNGIDNVSVLKALKGSVEESKGLTQQERIDDVYDRLGIYE